MTAIIFDGVVGLILLVSTVIAVMRGFVREVLTIVGLVGAVATTWFFGGALKGFYTKHVTSWAESNVTEETEEAVTHLSLFSGKIDLPIDLVSMVCSYGTIFLVVFLGFAILNFYLSGFVQDSKLSIVDRSMGAAFGLLRGVLLAALLFVPVSLFIGDDEEDKPQWVADSKTAPLLQYSVSFAQDTFFAETKNDDDADKDGDAVSDIKETVKDMVDKVAKENAQDLNLQKLIDGKTQKNKEDVTGYEGKERQELDNLIEREVDKN